MTRRIPAALLALAAIVALAGCGEKSEPTSGAPRPERVRLMLDYFPNADHAGIYAAQADGEFKRAGLDLDLVTPPDPASPLKLLAAGKVDAAISYEPELLLARDEGVDLVSIGALVQRPLTSIMSLGGAVRTPADLEGKKVGTAGIPYQSAYLKTIIEAAGGDPSNVDEIDVGFALSSAMISGRVDATLGAFWNYEGVLLERREKNPTIIRVDDAGVPTYNELVIVVRRSQARTQGPLLRRLMQALARGHQQLREDPKPGIDALLDANRDLDAGLERAAVRATLPVFFPTATNRPFGFQSPAAWRAYARWMLRNDLVKQLPDVRRAMTNEFLPGQGV